MSEYKFYYPDGEEITKEQFIDFYSKVYRYENHKHWGLEVEMEKLLDPDNDAPLTTEDIADILCWKADRTQEPTEDEEYHIVNRSRTIIVRDNAEELSEMNQFNGLEHKIVERSAKDFVSHFTRCGYAASRAKDKTSGEIVTNFGIGSVYAITLLFFASKGEYPIYDKYAHIGLASISSGGNPTDERFKISDSSYAKMFHTASRNEKGDITDTAIGKAWDDYMGYKCLLMGEDEKSKGIFGDVYDEHGFHYRPVDRALWAYGHLFYKS